MIGEKISCQPSLALSIGAVTGTRTAFSKGQDGRGLAGFVVKRAPCQGWCSLLLNSWRLEGLESWRLECIEGGGSRSPVVSLKF
jgi:hypothetical protein